MKLICTLLLAAAPLAAQQPDTFRLKELVVTATRTPLPRAAIPAAVTIIDRAELQLRGVRSVADVLRDVGGMSVAQAGSYGGLTSVFVRGGESDYVQVLIDGVQINDPGGVVSFADLTVADIERIEIVRGPVSVLYGSDAVAGVIQIFTRAGSDRTRVTAELGGGGGEKVGDQADDTFRVLDWNAGITGALAALRYGITASGTHSDGIYAFNNDYDNTTVSGKLHHGGARTDATLSGRYADRQFHYPTTGAGSVVDHNKFASGDVRTLGFDAGQRVTRRLEVRAAAGAHRAADGETNPPDVVDDGSSRSRSIVERQTADVRVNLYLPYEAVATLGAEREWQRGRSAFHSESEFGPFDSGADNRRRNTGWYAQLTATPLTRTSVTLGARVDDNDRFGTFFTYRAGLAQRFSALRVHAAVGTGFKEPTFYENYATGFVRGDPALQPEESFSIEMGAELSQNNITIGITAFDQTFHNLIQYTAAPPSPEAPSYHNIGEAVSRGVELSAVIVLPAELRAHAAYTYLHTDVTDDGFGEDRLFQAGQQLIRRPTHQASMAIDVPITSRTHASVTARYVGKRNDLDFTDPVEWQGKRVVQPAYGTIDMAFQHDILAGARSLTGFLRVENLLDERYEPVFNFPARPRVLRLGVRASY